MWRESLNELKKTRTIVIAGLLSALNVILGMFDIPIIPQTLYLSFGFVSVSSMGYLCGPFVCGIAGAICDILKFLVNPQGAFFLGFTINELLAGIIYGAFLYHKKPNILRCLACKFTVNIAINVLLTPLWLHMMYGKAWVVYASTRILKNIVLLPIECLVMFYILKFVERIQTTN